MSAKALEIYAAALRKWNRAINLVSPNTLDTLEDRHIQDSLQLLSYLPAHPVTLMDWGSGGGLPGMVLALSRLDDEIHLVESDEKKGEFLRHVSRETSRPVFVHTSRIEAIDIDTLTPDFITARALAPLADLCALMIPWTRRYPAVQALFLKGQSWQDELNAARLRYDFTYETHPSTTDKNARIIHITSLTPPP